MTGARLLLALLLAVAISGSGAGAQAPRGGTIEGHVRLAGPSPGNPPIRMGADPMCGRMYHGERPLQQLVVADAAGNLANVFVNVEGTFKNAGPAPATPVVIDQRGCVFTPRVIGARAGQPLQIRNSDALTHNAHGITANGNTFNVSQPQAGIASTVALTHEERMLRIRCDIHSWMTTWVGVMTHPYYAVSDTAGTFRIANVPAGRYTIHAWHERYGDQTLTVAVAPGQTAKVEFSYK
jgi:plastocyanin